MKVDFYAETEGYSGIENYSRNLLEALQERDCELNHVSPPDSRLPRVCDRMFMDFFSLRKLDADIVHLTSQDLLSGIFTPSIDNLVVTIHDIFPYLGYSGKFYSMMARNYVRNIENKADKVIAISEATKEQLLEHTSVEEDRIEVVYQGVDLETFRLVEEDVEYDNYYLHVGHELDRKNMEGLISVFEKIKSREPDAKLVRVGNSERTHKILENSELQKGVDVKYEQNIKTERLVELYSNAEKLLFPSEAEGFGRPILESLACGTPVVAFNRKPMSEVLPLSMLVEWEDLEKFAEKATKLSAKPEECRKIAGQYTWSKTARETHEVYEDV